MTLLNDLKVLDFSTLLPGPFATLLLADLGAEVIHVTRPIEGERWKADHYLLRSKKSIAVNLKEASAVRKMKELVKQCDIVIEQFRPGVMERLGLGYEALKAVNPSLIYCSITGFGQTGPYEQRPGHDINYISIAGLASYSGTAAGGPANNSTQIADIAGGSLHAAVAILAALHYRHRTGEGQHIDISMTDCAFTMNALIAQDYFLTGQQPGPENTLLNGGTFYGFYETADGRYVSVGSLEPAFRRALCEAIERPDLLDICMNLEPEHIRYFKQVLTEVIKTKTYADWCERFEAFESCVEPVLTFGEACAHPQLVARQMVVDVPVVGGGTEKQMACPIKTSVLRPTYKHTALAPGANNTEFGFS